MTNKYTAPSNAEVAASMEWDNCTGYMEAPAANLCRKVISTSTSSAYRPCTCGSGYHWAQCPEGSQYCG